MSGVTTAEHKRLAAHHSHEANWRKWGPYLSERGWGTVREDYSPHGTAWDYFPHDHARSRAYRWNEDGLAGISDRFQYLCFAIALWNGRDPILKERLFGLSGPQGNHGEDVKEVYFYLDSTPTHSYMKMLYKYPQAAYPYTELVEENGRRSREDQEYELFNTGVFAEDRYFDVLVEYAKIDQDDILIRVSIANRGPEAATCHLLPTLWFRNTWSWGYPDGPMNDVPDMPRLKIAEGPAGSDIVEANHPAAGTYYLYADGTPKFLFTGNETNMERLFDAVNLDPYVKDAFHRYVVNGEWGAVNPDQEGTKAAAWYRDTIPADQTMVYQLRLSNRLHEDPFRHFDSLFRQRQEEADEFYAAVQHPDLDHEARLIQRQAFAGLLWTKQLYYYDVPQWLQGDPGQPAPPAVRRYGRNADWTHLNNFDVISMPDKWEYPWYAAWDLAFHTLPIALVDPDFAKRQLTLMTREWYMHPNGQLPAYEWAFGDVNPPVHAWAAWRVYQIEAQQTGEPDREFLEGIFHKLLLNFTWWVNRKDADGNNIFQGGFLGLDNIGVFDRNADLPIDGHIDQADGTAWMGFYCLIMLEISLELAKDNPVYQDMATKFFEHFLRVAHAMTKYGRQGDGLWDEGDGFFYDAWHTSEDEIIPMKVRSLVGLLPLFAVAVLEPECLDEMTDFDRRLHWFMENRPVLAGNMASVDLPGVGQRRLLAILTRERLIRVLRRMLDEDEFLSPYGIRSLSKHHQDHPYTFNLGGESHTVDYEPGESRTWLFGGNSNWRGPIWFPTNYLIVESLRTFHRYYGDGLKVEFPTGSGQKMNLAEVAEALSQRLQRLFQLNGQGQRPALGSQALYQQDPHWQDLILFYEYFHGDEGAGLGASHQTGWTALVANLIHERDNG
ncbi:MAG: glucosidase [Anaerolineae bacterium SG8_19]|nr:MAG: glucosidase [Anaerolineae bacterium SG8_19]